MSGYENVEALQVKNYTTEKQKYTKEHWITRWIRSNMESPEIRIKRHEGFYQYCMDRYLAHVVAKQLGKEADGIGGGYGRDQTFFATSPRYQQINAHAQELLKERLESGNFQLPKEQLQDEPMRVT